MTDEDFERFVREIKYHISDVEKDYTNMYYDEKNPIANALKVGALEAISKVMLKVSTMHTAVIARDLKILLDKGMNSKDTVICSAFPGTGKSTFHNRSNLSTMDSDSSKFDKSEFPTNYIRHIAKNIGKVDIIFVSSHKEVREALVKNGMKFVLVYPTASQKESYLKRYKDRGSDDNFIQLLDDNWHTWISELGEQKDCDHIVLPAQQYLIDATENLMKEVK